MFELPLGKALIVQESEIKCNDECNDEKYECPIKDCCIGCVFHETDEYQSLYDYQCGICKPNSRKDGKRIIYKIIDYKP